VIEGIVKNVVAFGAFVDIGLKNDGLVHISQITDRFIKDPNEVLEVGQDVKVKVLKIEGSKISLGMRGV
jgi:yhgF like protein